MDKVVAEYLTQLELGEPTQYENMTVIPLFSPSNHGPEYLTLAEALRREALTVTEVSEGGSVPDVRVANRADLPVLLLDSEELAGAKQNRVLNATILLKEHSETVIPVSCTEQGRWRYTSGTFADSGHLSPPKMRFSKQRSVTESLRRDRGHRSDQGEVWGEVSEMMFATDTPSPTSSMRDVYLAKQHDLEAYLEAFQPQPGQKGLMVLVNGEVMGLDVVSREEAYRELHPRLIKSYAIDALLERGQGQDEEPAEKGRAFLKVLNGCRGEEYESVGQGRDRRYEQKEIVGSALLYQDSVIHAAFFKMTEGHKARRARYRRGQRPPWLDAGDDRAER